MVKIFELSKMNKNFLKTLLFIDSCSEDKSVAEIQKGTKLSKVTVLNVLRELSNFSFVIDKRAGNTHYYRINLDNPIVKQIKILNNVSKAVSAVYPLETICEAYLLGSSARGENRCDSDFDILLISKLESEEIFKLIKKESADGRKINFMILKPFEYAKLMNKDPEFYRRIEKDKIRLI